ncbi:MAG: hypothetical protein DRJ37_02855 [Thermoprotei archaeon]|nr:MAG: hypothetical protein DRJ37_02855 [Thermoprotei archaeon]
MKMNIGAGNTLMVEGEARVNILGGSVEVFGYKIEKGSFSVSKFKALPLYVLENAEIEVEEGRVWLVEGKTIPNEWVKSVEEIKKLEKPVRIAVIGGIDVGKSGFITFLTNSLLKEHEKIFIIDADVGQSDIGPPTTIGLGVTERKIATLADVPLYDAVFVGSTSPHGLFHRCVSAVSILSDLAEDLGAEIIILNTTGWITDPGGRELKISKIQTFKPSAVVGIGEKGELEHLLRFFSQRYKVLRLPPAAYARKRSRNDRKVIRKFTYAKWFENSKEIEVSFTNIASACSFIFSGSKFSIDELKIYSKILGTRVLYGENCPEVYVFVVEDDFKVRMDRVANKKSLFLTPGFFKHLLVGIGSRKKMFEGLGIVTDINFEEWSMKILTSVPREKAEDIQFGYIKVNPKTFEEERWVDRWSF